MLWGLDVLASPGLLLSLAAAAAGSVVVLLLNRDVLDLAETFPEVLRVPGLRRVFR